MGMPEILITFKTQGTSAIERSARGVVALILEDTTAKTKTYSDITEIVTGDFSTQNINYIKLALQGCSKVIATSLVDPVDYLDALVILKNMEFNYLACPSLAVGTDIATWIKAQRANKKIFKAVLANSVSDDEGIINFTTTGIKVGEVAYTTAEYTVRLAGIFAGLEFTRSATYFVLPEVTAITDNADPDGAIDDGELILVNDGSKIKIARAVNSLTTFTADKGEDFSKIRNIEIIDMMSNDIRNTFADAYVGKIINTYDNKVLFCAAVNSYLDTLATESVLDPDSTNRVGVDIVAQTAYIASKGIDTSTMDELEIKKYNTGSNVFVAGTAKITDAMEDLTFNIAL